MQSTQNGTFSQQVTETAVRIKELIQKSGRNSIRRTGRVPLPETIKSRLNDPFLDTQVVVEACSKLKQDGVVTTQGCEPTKRYTVLTLTGEHRVQPSRNKRNQSVSNARATANTRAETEPTRPVPPCYMHPTRVPINSGMMREPVAA